LEQKEIDEKN
jgi:hypothetical protein